MEHGFFEVWDFESGNLLAAYDTEEETFALVRSMIEEHGPEAVQQWGVGRDHEGTLLSYIEGDALIQRALASQPAPR